MLAKLRNVWPFRPKKDDITFTSSGVLTLGVEIELQIVDPNTGNLASRAQDVLQATAGVPNIKPEFYLSTFEVCTGICKNVPEAEADLTASYDQIDKVGDALGLQFATTGCHPFARYADAVITPSPRYAELIERNQWVTRRMTVYGLHVHIGMASGDDCIRFNNFFLHFLPHLLALSGSSPFWQGEDTGLSSCRPSTYEALPTAGQPYHVGNWRDFEALYHTLKKCKSIQSMKDMWWDLRPSPNYGTLEIRVCDGPATLAEATAIVAYIHLLAYWFEENGSWLNQMPMPTTWVLRENKWRAMRHGTAAELVLNAEGDTRPIAEDIASWLDTLEPYVRKLGYQRYMAVLRDILAKGNSSVRQRAIYEKTQSLKEVVAFNAREFKSRVPSWES